MPEKPETQFTWKGIEFWDSSSPLLCDIQEDLLYLADLSKNEFQGYDPIKVNAAMSRLQDKQNTLFKKMYELIDLGTRPGDSEWNSLRKLSAATACIADHLLPIFSYIANEILNRNAS